MTLLVRHTDVLGGVVGGFLPDAPFLGWRVYEVTDTYEDPAGVELPAVRIRKVSGPPTDTITQHATREAPFFAPRVWPYGGGLLSGHFPDLAWYFLDPATLALVAGPLVPIGNTFSNVLSKDTRDKTPVTEHTVQWFEATLPTGPYIGVHVARVPSATYPLWVSGPPVEIVGDVLTRKGEAYDATSATAVVTAMNPKLHHLMPVTDAATTPQEQIDQLSEAYGFTLRASVTTGEAQFVYWREKLGDISALPVIDQYSVRGDGGPTFDLADSSRINRVRIAGQAISKWQPGTVMRPVLEQRKFLGIPVSGGKVVRWEPIPGGNAFDPDKPASGLIITSVEVVFDYSTDGVTPDADLYGEQEATIELGGLPAIDNNVAGGSSALSLQQWGEGVARLIFDKHARGGVILSAPVLRDTDGDTYGLLGEAVVIDLPHAVNPQLGQSPTSQRSGQRPYRVIERTPEPTVGPFLTLVDEGTGVQYATVPEFTIDLDDELGLWLVTITNAAALTADRAQIEFQVLLFAAGDTPDFTDPGLRYTIVDSSAWTDSPMPVRIGPFPIEHQVYVRLRAWLFGGAASDWSSWDGLGGGAVTGSISSLTVGTPTSDGVALSWTNTNTTATVRIEIKLDTETVYRFVVDLLPGSTDYTLVGLDAETDYDVRVVLVQGGTEVGTALTDSFLTDLIANQTALTTPTDAQVESDGAGGYALHVRAVFGPQQSIVFEEAVETAVGSGTPGSYVIVATVPAVVGGRTTYSATAPNDGLLRYLRAYATAPSYDDSAVTSALSVDPWASTPITVPEVDLYLTQLRDVDTSGAAKGSLLVHDGSAWQQLAVGSDTEILIADSAETLGVKWDTGGAYTDEQAQDAVGAILVDSSEINFTYTDATPAITAALIDNTIAAARATFAATKRALGRNTSGAGAGEEVTVEQILNWIASSAQGDILYRGASDWTRLGAGTSGQVLKTNGTGANPAWTTISGGGGSGVLGVDQAGYLGRYWAHETTVAATAYQSTNQLVNFTGTGSSAADIANDGLWIRNTVTAATSGSATALQAITGNQVRRAWKAVHVLNVKTYTDVSSIRLWAGMTDTAPQSSDDPASAHLAMFRYSTAVDGTAFWRTCTKDGSTLETQTTTVAVATDTPYLLRIELDAAEVRFYIDGTLVTTHVTNIPGINTPMGQNLTCTTLANAFRSIRYARQWGLLRT